ncbi:hypothetical protein [Paraburkholderia youngii]|uniref:hypothetical protein n=1 Tax=Paraburkholderia youngii TaxID=2782701 RepID=UPI003D2570D1
MGKSSRRKAEHRAAIGKLIEEDQKSRTPRERASGKPDGLPLDYIDLYRSVKHPIFKFLEVDLARMERSGETPEDIFPPNGECAEDAFVEAFVANSRRNPVANPWVYDRRQTEAVAEHQLRIYRCLLSFLHAGSKTYHFSEGLAESLSYTALNMPASALQLPVPAFAFVFHSDAASEALHAIAGSPVDAVRTITVFVRSDTLTQVGFRRLLINAYEHSDTFGHDYCVIARKLAMKDDWDLEQALHTDWDKTGMQSPDVAPSYSWAATPEGELVPGEGSAERFMNEKVRFIRMIVNGILYITSRGAEITEKLATRPIHFGGHRDHSSKDSVATRKFSMLGESIKQIPVVIDPTVKYEPSSFSGSKRSVKVRFLVPGFYRRPPNSPKDAPKDVWVSPHYKGPEMADLVNNPYIVR